MKLRFSFLRVLCGVVGMWCSISAAQPVSSLIIKLKPTSGGSVTLDQGWDADASNLERKNLERVNAVVQDAGVALHGHEAVGSSQRLLRLPRALQGQALDDAVRRLRLHPEVEYAEPNERMQLHRVPNDALYGMQWHLGDSGVNASALNMPAAWDRTTGTPIVVAVLDTGVRKGHPDLAGKLLAGYDFVTNELIGGVSLANDGDGRDPDPSDPGDWVTDAESVAIGKDANGNAVCSKSDSSWHGTFIAGQIAALTNTNGAGVVGVSWGATILPVRVAGKCGALVSDVLDAMRWAAGLSVAGVPLNPNPARILNLSFGGNSPCTPLYQDVVDEVTRAGALVIVASGNGMGKSGEDMNLKRPADCRNVMAVGAVQNNGAKTWYSFMGVNTALMAPGGGTGAIFPSPSASEQLLSTSNAGATSPAADYYDYKQGTSFSAPLAAGVAALMLSINPAISPAQLFARMRAGSRAHVSVAGLPNCSVTSNSGCNCTTALCGAGLLDANNALAQSVAPAAVIAVAGTTAPGNTITLNGGASAATAGASVKAYAWSASPALAFQNASAAQTTITLPTTPGSWTLRLQVTDTLGRLGEDSVTITTVSSSSAGDGGGATGWGWGGLLWLMLGVALWSKIYKQKAFYPIK